MIRPINLFLKGLASYKVPVRTLRNTSILWKVKVPERLLPKNLLSEYYDYHHQPFGRISDKKPFKIRLEANKKYFWCTCGESKSQPFCDGTHKIPSFKIKLKPIPFMVEKTDDYWLCNCKQSNHRPFCDGTHFSEDVQNSNSSEIHLIGTY